jgi:hypothetical protein
MSNTYFPEGGMDVVVLLREVGRGISDLALGEDVHHQKRCSTDIQRRSAKLSDKQHSDNSLLEIGRSLSSSQMLLNRCPTKSESS